MSGDTSANVRDPWKNVFILTLDGGGTRGYASLLMLQELMKYVAKFEQSDNEEFPGAHGSSFGRSDGNSQLVAKTTAPDPASKPKPTAGSRPVMISTQPPHKKSDRDTRRERTREELLEEKLKYLPCHYFDYIGGTSTGGLAALMLGRLRMSADECIERYPEMAKSIFGTKKSFAVRGAIRDRYFATNVKEVIDDIVLERLPENAPEEFLKLASPENLCKTVVVARKDNKRDGPYLFRSYDSRGIDGQHPHNPGNANTCFIWQAGRATSAAPHYFKAITIDGHTYYDGGVGYNDPTEEVYKDIRMRTGRGSTSLVLTLGTGMEPTLKQKAKGVMNSLKAHIKEQKYVKRVRSNINRLVKDTATNVEPVVYKMQAFARDDGFDYFKWHGGEEVGALGLDNCKEKAFEQMRTGIRNYMASLENDIERVARLLVQRRRDRFQNQDKWQSFAYCTLFDCPLDTHEHSFETRADLRNHIKREHIEEPHVSGSMIWEEAHDPISPVQEAPHESGAKAQQAPHDSGSMAQEAAHDSISLVQEAPHDPDLLSQKAPVMRPDLRGPFGHRLRTQATI